MGYYPLMFDVSQKPVLLLGTGKEAVQKVPGLWAAGAMIEVFSPRMSPEMTLYVGDRVWWRPRYPVSDDIKGHSLIIAADEDPAINKRVRDWAIEVGVAVNVVDVPEWSTVLSVSHLRRGDLVVSVSTSGRAPGLSRSIRQRLELLFADDWDERLIQLGHVRQQIRPLSYQKKTEVMTKAQKVVMAKWERELLGED